MVKKSSPGLPGAFADVKANARDSQIGRESASAMDAIADLIAQGVQGPCGTDGEGELAEGVAADE